MLSTFVSACEEKKGGTRALKYKFFNATRVHQRSLSPHPHLTRPLCHTFNALQPPIQKQNKNKKKKKRTFISLNSTIRLPLIEFIRHYEEVYYQLKWDQLETCRSQIHLLNSFATMR